MTDKIERPEIVTEMQLEYLDRLRESGETNMYGAAGYIRGRFQMNRRDSETIALASGRSNM